MLFTFRFYICVIYFMYFSDFKNAQTSLNHYVSFRESFERVDSLISPFGQTAIYLFPLAFAINTERNREEKKKGGKKLVFLAVYRCASSALPEMKKGDSAPISLQLRRLARIGGGEAEAERAKGIPEGGKKRSLSIIPVATLRSRYSDSDRTLADPSFSYTRRIDDRSDRRTKSKRESTSITEPFAVIMRASAWNCAEWTARGLMNAAQCTPLFAGERYESRRRDRVDPRRRKRAIIWINIIYSSVTFLPILISVKYIYSRINQGMRERTRPIFDK